VTAHGSSEEALPGLVAAGIAGSNMCDLHDAGVQLLVGTDAGGTIEYGRIAAEVVELVRAGLPDDVVVAAAS